MMNLKGKKVKIIEHTSTEVPVFDLLDENDKSLTGGWGWSWVNDEEETGWEWLTRKVEAEGGIIVERIWS
jgi:hypothetical protein